MGPCSIVIPSLNSPLIARVVDAVLAQEGSEDISQVLVVGRDEEGLLPRRDRVRMLDTGQAVNASAARNLGLRAANSDLLIFLDSDCVPLPGWLRGHQSAHAAGHAVVGGSVLLAGDSYWQLSYNLTMFHEVSSEAPAGLRPFLPTLNLSIDREVIDLAGELDAQLPYSHDVDWTIRMREAGYQPYFWPAATVRHEHNRRTLAAFWRDCAINGHFARQVRLRHARTLHTPALLRSRWATLLLSPLISFVITARIVAGAPRTMLRHWHAIPAIFLSKIAWCWGAFRR